ncbi:MAG TPA: DinB family protein [Vicinamibacteria bacterium]
MLQKEDFERMFAYNVWANHRLMRIAATLSVDDFKRDLLAASHGGVRGTLTHIMAAEWIWLERWKGVSPPRLFDEGEFADVVALRDRWTLIEGHREEWFRALRPEALGETVAYRSTEGVPWEAPLWKLVQHTLNHSTYHRGQVTLLLRALGARRASTDLVLWDRAQDAGAAEE